MTEPTKDPVVPLGPVTAPVVRTGAQVVTGAFVVQGLVVWGVELTDAQVAWSTTAATIAIAWAQNLLEAWRNRRLVGSKPPTV